jgi:hypothetical protein
VVPIREIVLDETGIDAGVSTALSGCTSLEVLRIKNSKVSRTSRVPRPAFITHWI